MSSIGSIALHAKKSRNINTLCRWQPCSYKAVLIKTSYKTKPGQTIVRTKQETGCGILHRFLLYEETMLTRLIIEGFKLFFFAKLKTFFFIKAVLFVSPGLPKVIKVYFIINCHLIRSSYFCQSFIMFGGKSELNVLFAIFCRKYTYNLPANSSLNWFITNHKS